MTSESGDALGKRIGAVVEDEIHKQRGIGAGEINGKKDLRQSKIYNQLVKLLRQVDLFKGDDNTKGLRQSDLEDIIQVMDIE